MPRASNLRGYTTTENAVEEWYTPKEVVDLVVNFLGGVDLDPCSNMGIPNVPALHYFTKEDNGLIREWHGKVFINPPYGGPKIRLWCLKMLEEYRAGRVQEGLVLTYAGSFGNKWWQTNFGIYPFCVFSDNLKFINPESRESKRSPFPSILIYVGTRIQEFRNFFSSCGYIWSSNAT